MPRELMGAGFLAAQSESAGWQPQLQSNFEVRVYGITGENNTNETDYVALSVDTASLPNITFGEIELHHLNERAYMAGGVTYETIPLTCKDIIDYEIMNILYKWVGQVYNPINGRMGLAKDYKKSADIYLYGPDGGYDRWFTLQGVWPQAANFGGTLDQSAKEAISQIELTLRYDKIYNANLVPGPVQGLGNLTRGNEVSPLSGQ